MYDYRSRFQFSHDSDLSAWVMKDIVFDGHIRLIGQLTSAPGVFIGGLFYYSLIPLYAVANYDPLGTVSFSWIIGAISIISIFYVVAKIHTPRAALYSSIIYAVSFGITQTEREVVPTTLIFLWSIWFYYLCHAVSIGRKGSLFLAAVLFALVWHIQLNLAVLSILILFIFGINLRKFTIREVIISIVLFLILMSPFIAFEARHGFTQTKSLFGTARSESPVKRSFSEKVMHVLEYASKNINYIFWERPKSASIFILPLLIIGCSYVALYKKKQQRSLIVIGITAVIMLGFFVFHPINLSEYYINGLNVMWVILAGITLSIFKKRLIFIPLVIISMFVLHNIYRLVTFRNNDIGYLQKTALIQYIKNDSDKRGFPCVSYSFITDRGYELGYRYLTWRSNLKLAPISTNTPVYSIVFPHTRVNRIDQSFGALGLVLPDYDRYTRSQIIESCNGADYNLTESMFGFTK